MKHHILEEWKDGGSAFLSVSEFADKEFGRNEDTKKVFSADVNHDTKNVRIIWAEQDGPILKRDVFNTDDNDDENDEYWTQEITPERTFERVTFSIFIEDDDEFTQNNIQEYIESSLDRE